MSLQKSVNPTELAARRQVGIRAAALVADRSVVGLGTGSTAACAIEELGRRVREEGLAIVGVPTSWSAERKAREVGIPLRTLAEVERIDLALDGADEVSPALDLIKGGGAAHTMEKIVATFADRFVVLVDDGKLVAKLGARWPVPVEVLPAALAPVERWLRKLGAEPTLRTGNGKDGPVVTDHGNVILDAKFPGIDDPRGLAAELDGIPGVLDHGLFVGLAKAAIIGSRADGSVTVRP